MVKFQARMGVGTSLDQLDPGCWAWVGGERFPQGSLLKWTHHRASWVSHINDLLGESGWRCRVIIFKRLEPAPEFHATCQGL